MIPAPRDADDPIEVVRRAGAEVITLRFRDLERDDVQTKSGPGDHLTAADCAAEEATWERSQPILSGATVTGEEAVANCAERLDAIEKSETCRIMDPNDSKSGSVVEPLGLSTMMHVVYRGRAGIRSHFDPVPDDRMSAVRSDGARFRNCDGTCARFRFRDDVRSRDRPVGCGIPEDNGVARRKIVRNGFNNVLHAHETRRSRHECCLVAPGSISFLRSFSLNRWGQLLGRLLLDVAGGGAAIRGERPCCPAISEGKVVATGS